MLLGALGLVAAVLSHAPGLRIRLAVVGLAFSGPGVVLLVQVYLASRAGATLQPLEVRDLTPAALIPTSIGLFAGTWLLLSPARWAERLHREIDAVRRLGGVAVVVGVVGFALFIALLVMG